MLETDTDACTICHPGSSFLLLKACVSTVLLAGREAGDTYSKLGEIHVKQDSKADAAQAYVEASKAYQRVDKSSKHAI